MSEDERGGLLPAHGGYRRLRSFQIAEQVYDGTVAFCARFVERGSRTRDQMVQAARSGRQNIAEGSMASATSKKTELKLTNVAKASLEELLLDYEDYLRQHGLRRWEKDAPETRAVRDAYREGVGDIAALGGATAEAAANTLICLIHQATYLLRRQIERLGRDFLAEGGFTERLHAERVAARAGREAVEAPRCPRCGKAMARRRARQGAHAGEEFWGCTGYPDCRATRALEAEAQGGLVDSDGSDASDESDKSDGRADGEGRRGC